jgi:transcriptional regulator with XRE-family HTH domain
MKTVEQLCLDRGLDVRQLAERSGVDEQRIVAILMGRWTPSPQDRDAIAKVFETTRDLIVWGHKTPIQHIYGSGPG